MPFEFTICKWDPKIGYARLALMTGTNSVQVVTKRRKLLLARDYGFAQY